MCLIEAANRVLQERGFAATTAQNITEAAGVNTETVMAIGGKSALLVRVLNTMLGDKHARRADVDRQPIGDADSCAKRLHILVQPFVTMFTGRPELT